MTFELDRKDIIAMLKGTDPSYEVMAKIPNDLGRFYGGFRDEWKWSYSIPDSYSDEELLDYYLMIKTNNESKTGSQDTTTPSKV